MSNPKSQQQIYEKLYHDMYDKNKIGFSKQNEHNMQLSRQANLYAIKNTISTWKKQFKHNKSIIFEGRQIAYIVEESEAIDKFNSVRFLYNDETINENNLELEFYNK
jgi:cytidylate kinase